MTTSVKSKAELEQVALAMMIMAGGEGTSTSPSEGVKTRSSRRGSSSSSSQIQIQPIPPRRNSLRDRGEPVSGAGVKITNNCLNKNGRRAPPEMDEVDQDHEGDYEDGLDPSSLGEEECGTAPDMVLGEDEPEPDEAIVCAINPMAMMMQQSSPSPSPGPESPTRSQNSNSGGSGSVNGNGGGGGGGGAGANGIMDNDCVYMSSSRRIFRPEFKKRVLDAFAGDPECVGNQRATARKFGIHRRQVQKWLQQLATGELNFKDLDLKPASTVQETEDCFPERTTSVKLSANSSSKPSRPTLAGNRNGKVLTRRSVGLGSVNRTVLVGNSHPQAQGARNGNGNGRASEPPSRANSASARNRGKSMPLKGGSKSSANHFAPSSGGSSKSLLNLTKGAVKQNGGAGSGYGGTYSESNGNGSGGANMFMNMSTLLASAAAAGNLGMPLSLEHPRNFSPREHSPLQNNGRGSPAHSAGGSSGSGSMSSNLQTALSLVDELNYLYPYSDFSLLRKALLKEEVSLEKLAVPLMRSRVNGNSISGSDLSSGLRRSAQHSPPPKSGSSSQQEYNTQQTLDIIRQQQEYLKLLQQCGIGNSADLGVGLNLADLASTGKLPAWFNPFAAAAAAGVPIQSTTAGNNGGKFGLNGNGRRKDMDGGSSSDNHRFASPRIPPTVNSGKMKTVAAALAHSRVQSVQPQNMAGSNRNSFGQNGNRQNQNRGNGQRRKPNPRQAQRSQNAPQMDDEIDPTSMLEVVTSIPSPSNSPRNSNSNSHYGYNGGSNHHQRINGNANADFGMDLSTSSTSSSSHTPAPAPTRLISKAMSKEYSFLNELGLVRKSSPEKEPGKLNGYGLTHTASLENFVQNILPRQKSPPAASSSTSSSSPPAQDLNDGEKTKNLVIDAFTYDPNLSEDARAVARKFGLSVRVVLKWLKEGPAKSSSHSSGDLYENGLGGSSNDNNNFPRVNREDEEEDDGYLHHHHQAQNMQKVFLNESNNNSGGVGVNKRKNSKPNQICDFPVEVEDEAGLNAALDMVVPIKKRRVSSPTPQDA